MSNHSSSWTLNFVFSHGILLIDSTKRKHVKNRVVGRLFADGEWRLYWKTRNEKCKKWRGRGGGSLWKSGGYRVKEEGGNIS